MRSDEERNLNALHTRQKLELLKQQKEQQQELKQLQQKQLKQLQLKQLQQLEKSNLRVVKRKSLLPTIEEKHSSSSKSRVSSPRVATPRVATPCPYCFRRTRCTGKKDDECDWHKLEALFKSLPVANKVAR